MADFGLNHIPFGLRESDEAIVDVFAVKRGRECGCICPSCRTPLIARQGEEKVWHFAHASRHVYDRTAQECDFSFYVSVRLMARQLIGSRLTLALPDYRGRVTQYVEDLHQTRTLDYLVTEARSVELEHVEVETCFADVAVDVKGKVGNFDFVIYLVHPGRVVPTELESLDGAKAGVVAIDLQKMAGALARVKDAGGTYSQALGEFLAKNVASKRWVFHPRNAVSRQRAVAELAKSVAREVDEVRHRLSIDKALPTERGPLLAATKNKATQQVQCECLFCGTKWDGHDPGLNNCPKCRTRRYANPIPKKSNLRRFLSWISFS
jgi:ssDNA-binding Zn-finger/Zn-ribbon topoisomerase 1